MIYEILILIALTFAPFLELRASIPYGIFNTDLHWGVVFLVCVLANIAIGPLLYIFFDKFIGFFLRFKKIKKIYMHYVEKNQAKIHDAVEKYGILGVAIFIGVPLPGTGVYSAALGSYAIGLSFKRFFIATILGVLIAGIAVLAICFTGDGLFSLFIKKI